MSVRAWGWQEFMKKDRADPRADHFRVSNVSFPREKPANPPEKNSSSWEFYPALQSIFPAHL